MHRELEKRLKLHHENVLPLYGICYHLKPIECLASPWMQNGDLFSYIQNDSPKDYISLVCV